MPVPEAVGSKRVVQIIRLHPPAMISTWLWCYAAEFKVAGSIPGLSGCKERQAIKINPEPSTMASLRAPVLWDIRTHESNNKTISQI